MLTMLTLSGETPPATLPPTVDGVGLIRGEYLFRAVGHYVLSRTGADALTAYLDRIATLFAPAPVWYRLADFESREISTLVGADHDVEDDNPILGHRGARRGLVYPEALAAEIAVVTEAARRHPHLGLLVPYVGDERELDTVLAAARTAGFPGPVGCMVEIPSAALRVDALCDRGLANLTIGLNDLTTLLLGADRPSPFADKSHPVVLETVAAIGRRAGARGVPVTVAGDVRPDLLPALAEAGVDRVCVHYRDLPLFRADLAGLPDLDVVARVKARTKAALAARAGGPPPYADHFRQLGERLAGEVRAHAQLRGGPDAEAVDRYAAETATFCHAVAGGLGFEASLTAYDRLCARKVELFEPGTEIAARYRSMAEFWADAAAQPQAASARTYWDTYEHGRRRWLENRLAEAYGSPGALLLNTGMSAVDTAIQAAALRPGDTLLTHTTGYFETTDYLDNQVTSHGVRMARADLTDADAFRHALVEHRPRAVLLETATNCPEPAVPVLVDELWNSDVTLLVDNSVLSHGFAWFDLVPAERTLVIESGIKYLTRRCTAGVVYGGGELLDRARAYARRVGQQLQERAFSQLQVGELELAAERVAIHGGNTVEFAAAIDPAPWQWIRHVATAVADRADPVAARLTAAGPGSLLFLRLAADEARLPRLHRALVARWVELAAGEDLCVDVRAGFGWNRTSARAYESTALNQPDAPTYVRLSLGLEPAALRHRLATLFDKAVHEVVSQ